MRRNLEGRSILVTGASRGIGRRVAERLAKLGAKLTVSARSRDELDSLVVSIRASGGTAEAVVCDLSNALDREHLILETVERYGSLDVLFNCASVASFGEFESSSEAILRQVMEINFFAPADLIRLAIPHLTESSTKSNGKWRAAVVNVASICGRAGVPSLSEYCASKHAIVGLTEALRAELSRFDIDTTLILPGLVLTDDLNRHLLRNEGQIDLDFQGAQPPDEVAESAVRRLISGRREKAVGRAAWWLWVGRRVWPGYIRWIMRRKVRKFAERTGAK